MFSLASSVPVSTSANKKNKLNKNFRPLKIKYYFREEYGFQPLKKQALTRKGSCGDTWPLVVTCLYRSWSVVGGAFVCAGPDVPPPPLPFATSVEQMCSTYCHFVRSQRVLPIKNVRMLHNKCARHTCVNCLRLVNDSCTQFNKLICFTQRRMVTTNLKRIKEEIN